MRFRFLLLGIFSLFALVAFAQDDGSTDDTSASSDTTDTSAADDSATWAPVTDDGTGADSSASSPSDDGTSSDASATSSLDSFETSSVDTSASVPTDASVDDASLGGTSLDGSTDGSNTQGSISSGDASLGGSSIGGASVGVTPLDGSTDGTNTLGSTSVDSPLGGASVGGVSTDGTSSGGSLLDGTSLSNTASDSAPASDAGSAIPAERFAHRGLVRRAPTNAPVVSNNPIGTQYTARLPDKNDTTIRGAININSNANGTGANVQVSISGLPDKGGPFMYHIHQYPITGLNCTSAGAHLDPYGVTESPPCDHTQPDKCQVGDLSGKYGNMTGPSFSANYVDLYLSTQENTPAFVGNLSIVVHASDKKRLTCANFALQGRDLNTSIVTLHPHPAPTVSITSDVTASPTVTDAPTAAPTVTTTYTPSEGGVVKNADVAAMNLGCALVAMGAWFL